MSDKVLVDRVFLKALAVDMNHAVTFIESRQKMAPVGVEQHKESLKQLRDICYKK